MLDRTQYFGVCIRPPGVEGKPGRLRILGEVYLNDDGHWANVANFDRAAHSPSEHAFWPQHPPALEVEHGTLLRLSLERTRFHGDPHKDWHSVRRRWDGAGQWDFTLFGAYVFNLLSVEWNGRQQRAAVRIEEEAPFLPSVNSTVYFRKSDSGRMHLIGPWTVTSVQSDKIRLVPRDGAWVCDYPVPPNVYNIGYLRHPAGEFFLGELNPAESTVIDLAPSEESRRWLLEQIGLISPEVTSRLDREDASWRDRLTALLEQHADPIKRQLGLQRWQQALPILESLTAEETLASQILESEAFREKLQEAIRLEAERQIERRAAQLTAEARQRMPSYERLEELNQGELQALERQVAEKQTLLAKLESQVTDAASHFHESRDRLVKDFLGFQECVRLLENGHSREAAAALRATPAAARLAPAAMREPEQPPLVDFAEFLDRRLAPAAAQWAPQASRAQLEALHDAVLACRWCWAPHIGWARLYAEALGGAGLLWVVTVEPGWRRFDDGCAAGIGEAFQQAETAPDQVVLLALEGVDRPATAAWAIPWLHLAAGVCDTLPHGVSGWPENLRILATCCQEPGSAPLASAVWNAGGAVPRSPQQENGGAAAASPLSSSRVTAEAWRQWARVDLTDPRAASSGADLGWWSHRAAVELFRLRQIVERNGRSGEEAERLARAIRLEAPREYLR